MGFFRKPLSKPEFNCRINLHDWALPLSVGWGPWDYARTSGVGIHFLCWRLSVAWDRRQGYVYTSNARLHARGR